MDSAKRKTLGTKARIGSSSTLGAASAQLTTPALRSEVVSCATASRREVFGCFLTEGSGGVYVVR